MGAIALNYCSAFHNTGSSINTAPKPKVWDGCVVDVNEESLPPSYIACCGLLPLASVHLCLVELSVYPYDIVPGYLFKTNGRPSTSGYECTR